MENPAAPSPGRELPTEGISPLPHQRGATLTLIGFWLIPTVLIAIAISVLFIYAKSSTVAAVIGGTIGGAVFTAAIGNIVRAVSWVLGHLLPADASKHLGEAISTRLNLLWQSANHQVVIVG